MTYYIPGTRYCTRTGQYFPTLNGRDCSPTSFDESRAAEIAEVIAAQTREREERVSDLEGEADDLQKRIDDLEDEKQELQFRTDDLLDIIERMRSALNWIAEEIRNNNDMAASLAIAEQTTKLQERK